MKVRSSVHSNSYKIVAPLQLHNNHVAPVVLELTAADAKGECVALGVLVSGESTATPKEFVEKLFPVFEDVPLEAYSDKPPKAPVFVFEALQGFADTLYEEIKFDIPVLPKGVAGFGSSESDPW